METIIASDYEIERQKPMPIIHVFRSISQYEVYQASQILKDAVLEIELDLKEIFV